MAQVSYSYYSHYCQFSCIVGVQTLLNQVGRGRSIPQLSRCSRSVTTGDASVIEVWVRCHLLNSSSTSYKMRGKHSCLLELFSKMLYTAEFSERREEDIQL